jgi:hypothetical protein
MAAISCMPALPQPTVTGRSQPQGHPVPGTGKDQPEASQANSMTAMHARGADPPGWIHPIRRN